MKKPTSFEIKNMNKEVLLAWEEIVKKDEDDISLWIQELRKLGYKAAHPNDCWVKGNEVTLVYPQFNDGVDVGDKIMLGWQGENERPIVLIKKIVTMFDVDIWKFKDIK